MEPFALAEQPGMPGLLYLDKWMTAWPGLTAGFTSRLGGVSAAEFQSLNCGLHVADAAEAVIENRSLTAAQIGMPLHSWTFGEQVHGTRAAVVSAADRGKGTLSRKSALQDTDSFITQDKGVCLAALFADCVPLYFFDPVHEAVGLAHAGWKGTVGQIAAETVAAMGRAFGSQPQDLYAAIGPSIHSCCYEVDETVMSRARGLAAVLEERIVADLAENPWYKVVGNGKYMLNLQEMNRKIMIKAGILPSNIEVSEWCTGCSTDLFFSHRKENGKTGRMMAWIGLKR